MRLPEPRPGLVIRYSFLWSHERAGGAVEGAKDRPCVVLLAQRPAGSAGATVAVLPITHEPPQRPLASHLELTAAECRSVGLDGDRHWVVLREVNRFAWPGYDLRAVPGTDRCDYGRLAQPAFARIVAAFKAFDLALKGSGRRGVPMIGRDD